MENIRNIKLYRFESNECLFNTNNDFLYMPSEISRYTKLYLISTKKIPENLIQYFK